MASNIYTSITIRYNQQHLYTQKDHIIIVYLKKSVGLNILNRWFRMYKKYVSFYTEY